MTNLLMSTMVIKYFLMESILCLSIFYALADENIIPTALTGTTTNDEDQFKCSVPDMIINGTILDKTHFQSDFTSVSEIKFPGIVGPLQERVICKIKCIDGQWVGPLCAINEEGRFQPIFRECTLPQSENTHLYLTFRNRSISTSAKFSHGSIIRARCEEIGTYKLLGDSSLSCSNGDWNFKLPTCIPTSLLTNFTEDAPPTILIVVSLGSASVEPSGDLYVYPDTTVHLDCIVLRRNGNPEWSSTTNFQHHAVDWSVDNLEKNTHYRLILSYVKPQDSGIYTCATAHGITNSITIHVASVHCKALEVSEPFLTHWVEGTNLGQSIRFSCAIGFVLNGTANLTCQGSGSWSDGVPNCVKIVCPRLSWPQPALELVEYESSYGGRAVFQCAWGYRLVGTPAVHCDHEGHWTGVPPTCIAVECPPPLLPVNGHLAEWVVPPKNGMYNVGDLVQYGCKDPSVLQGEASIVCTETGFWSHPPPFCVEKSNSTTDYEFLS